MNFWVSFAAFLLACAAVYYAVSINGATEHAGGHDDHAHGHDDHGHGKGHGHH
jgi:hypothetical protein